MNKELQKKLYENIMQDVSKKLKRIIDPDMFEGCDDVTVMMYSMEDFVKHMRKVYMKKDKDYDFYDIMKIIKETAEIFLDEESD